MWEKLLAIVLSIYTRRISFHVLGRNAYKIEQGGTLNSQPCRRRRESERREEGSRREGVREKS